MGDDQALTQFILIAVITYFFNKNMTVVMLVALLMTNFLKVTTIKVNREGMKNKKKKEKDDEEEEEEGGMDTGDIMDSLQDKLDDATDKLPDMSNSTPALEEPRRKSKNSRAMEKDEFEKSSLTNKTKKSKKEKFQNAGKKGSNNYVDQAATLEAAYDNLDGILGKDGISSLTKETEFLVKQQKNLAKTMESMAPLVKNAKEMLAGFNLSSLKGVAGVQGLMK